MQKVFISYAHADENYRKELEKHLTTLKRNGIIDTWTDRKIMPGELWEEEISEALYNSRIILLLVSSDFLDSKYCYEKEMLTAIERHKSREAIVVPIILRFCDWSETPFATLQALPLNAKPIKDWIDQDQAYLSIVEGIKKVSSLENLESLSIFSPKTTPEQALSKIYEQVILSKNKRDLRKALFDLKKYKTDFPDKYEIEELEVKIRDGLSYHDTSNYSNSVEGSVDSVHSLWKPTWTIGCLILILIVCAIVYFVFFRK